MMADRHWVGGTGSWTAANTANWSTTPGGAGGASVPTAADDVFISASSGGGTLTIATNVALAKSLDFTGFTGNLVLNQGWTLSGGLTLSSSMGTITGGGYYYTFNATNDNGGAGWPINMNGKAFPYGPFSAFAFSGVGGKWVLQGNANFGTSQINVSAGTFDTGNYSVTASGITSNSTSSRTLTFGSSAITVTAQANPWLIGGSAPTITANTAVVTMTGNTNGVAMGSVNYNGLSLVFNNQSTQAVVFTGHFTVRSITFTGSATKLGGASFAGNVVCTDSFVVNGNSAVNRFIVSSSQAGNTISINAPSVTLSNVDFMDINATGAAAPWTGTSLGDCLGNSNITFPAGATQYYVTSASSNWSDATKWASSSGGTGGTGRVPLPQDDVRFDANSITASGRIISIDMPRIGSNVDLTGVTRSPTLAPALSTTTMYGSLTWATGVTAGQSSNPWVFAGRGTHTIIMNGAVPLNWAMFVVAPGGSYSLGGAITLGGGAPGVFNVLAGTFDTNNYTMVVGSFASTGSTTRTVNLGTSTVTLTAAAGTWNIAGTGLTLSAASATIAYGVSASARSFAGNGFTYGTLDYSVANSPGTLAITGSNTFGTLDIGPGRTVTSPAAVIQTIGSLNASGQNNGYLYIGGSSSDYAGTPDATQNQITGDIDIRVDMAPNSWTAGTSGAVIGKDSVGGAGRVWQMGLTASGVPTFTWWDSGGTLRGTFSASTAVSFTGNTRGWIRVTLDVDNGSGGHALKFWTSPAGTPVWTQLGSTLSAGAFTTSMRNQSALVSVGSAGGSGANPAKFYRAQIRNNILDDGTGIVVDMNFSAKAFGANTFTESSVNAATVTLAGTALVGDGRVTLASLTASSPTYLMLAGEIQSFDYLAVQDVVSLLPYKFYAGTNSVNVSGNTNVLFSNYVTSTPYPAFVAEVTATGTSATMTPVIPPGQAVVSGDLMVVDDRYGSNPTVSVSGFTAVGSTVADATNLYMSVFSKVAVGGETNAVLTSSSSASHQAQLLVIRGLNSPVLDVSDSATNGAGTTTTLSTGSGVTNTAIPAFAMAYWGAQNVSNPAISFTNSFQQAKTSIAGQSANYSAFKPLTSLASQTSTLTTTSNMGRAIGRMIVFKGTPVVGGNYRFLFVQY